MKKVLLTLTAFCAAVSLNAQINVTGPIAFDNVGGGTVSPVFQGSAGTYEVGGVLIPQITGTLTGVTMDAILTNSVNSVYANDLTIIVTSSEDLTLPANYLLQIGGFSNFTANKFAWGCEPACETAVTSTPVAGTVSAFAGLDFTGSTYIIWLANGYVNANPPTTEGSWTINSMSFDGVTLASASLTENSIEASVYPNPAGDVLNVKTTGVASNVSIISMDGKVISTQAMNGTSAAVNVADLQAGAYFYQVTAEDGSVVTNTFMKK